jgi:hypothetical protein
MKKLYTTLVAIMAISQFSFGQWTTNPSTNDAYNNNVSGKVGIGTITPKAKLDVTTGTSALTSATLQTWNWVDDPNNWGLRLDQYHTGSAIDQRFIQRMGTSDLNVLTFHLGNVGIGTTTPGAKLDIAGTMQSDKASANGDGANIILRNANAATLTTETRSSVWLDNDGKLKLRSVTGHGIAFRNTHNSNDILHINDNGMAIGAALPTGYMLAVNGKVITKEIRVDASWADYVFNEDYKLRTISEVESYIKKNHHLPDVPSAAEVEKNGVALGETVSLLLKKIEELTLYLIEKDKQVDNQKKQLAAQQLQIEKQDSRVSAMEQALKKLAGNN